MKMSVFSKAASVLAAAVLVAGLAACDSDGGGGGGGPVDFTNFQGADRSISVTNNTSERLVAFRGTPGPHTLIGGIPAHANNHGLRRGGPITSTGDFPLVLVRESVVNANSGNLAAISVDDHFATLWAFFNTTASNDTVFQIDSRVGGDGELVLVNMTSWNVEIREGAAQGVTLGFVGPSTPRAVMRLNMPADYNIFPVFRRMHPTNGEIISVTPRFQGGNLDGQPFLMQFGLSDANRSQTFNVGGVLGTQIPNMSLGGVWIRVNNQNAGTGIQFQQGGTEFLTTAGIRTIAPAANATFQIDFPRGGNNQFVANLVMNQLQVGPGVNLQALGNQTLQLDWEYEIVVGGTNAGNVYIVPDAQGRLLRPVGALDVEALFNQFQ